MSDKYAGACWNQLMENESKESIAELYMNSLARVRELEAENERLKAEIGGFPNLSAMRQAMIDTADENGRLKAPIDLKREVGSEIDVVGKLGEPYLSIGHINAIIAARAAKEKP